MDKHVFLFEYIRQGSDVVIYGLGDIGNKYIEQIETTNWCNIVGISDRKNKSSQYPYMYYFLMEIINIPHYDYIVIAIEDISIASQVYQRMIEIGVDKSKIYNLNMRLGGFPRINFKSDTLT